MSENETPRLIPRPTAPIPGRAAVTTARRGAPPNHEREALVRYEVALLRTPFLSLNPHPALKGMTAIDQMVLFPSDPGEARRWTRFAALVVLGLK